MEIDNMENITQNSKKAAFCGSSLSSLDAGLMGRGVLSGLKIEKIETDIDQCLSLIAVMLTHNDIDLLKQDDIQLFLTVVDEKLRSIRGEVLQ